MKADYQYKDIEIILNIKQGRLYAWIELGYIRPTIKSHGSGTQNFYTLDDLYKIAAFKALIEYGLTRSCAAKLVRDFDRVDLSKFTSIITNDIGKYISKHIFKIDKYLIEGCGGD